MLRICSEEGGRGLDKCSKLAQKREGGVKKRPENAHMINERSPMKVIAIQDWPKPRLQHKCHLYQILNQF